MNHTAEEVRWTAQSHADLGNDNTAAMLRAYADMIEASEGAVPVYWIYDLGHWYLATKDAYDSWPTEKSKKLYAHPPAQAAQGDVTAMSTALKAIKLRLHFMHWPSEAMWNAGTQEAPIWVPDWRYEIALLEHALHGTPVTVAEKPGDTVPRHSLAAQPHSTSAAEPVAQGEPFGYIGPHEKQTMREHGHAQVLLRQLPALNITTPVYLAAPPAQSVAVEKVREVIAEIRRCAGNNNAKFHLTWADELEAAIQEKGNG